MAIKLIPNSYPKPNKFGFEPDFSLGHAYLIVETAPVALIAAVSKVSYASISAISKVNKSNIKKIANAPAI